MTNPNNKESFAEDFEHYLTVVDKLEHNTCMKYIGNVKKILIMALQKDRIQRNPISGFKCSCHNPNRNKLLKADLNKLISTPMPVARLEEVRACFVLMFFTGFDFQDAASLSQADLKKAKRSRMITKSLLKQAYWLQVP